MFAEDILFKESNREKYKRKIEEQLEDDELSFEEASFLMGYNDFA